MTEFVNKETGDEVEGLTQEESDKKVEEAQTKAEEEKAQEIEQIQKDHDEEKKNLEEQLEEKEAEVEKAGKKDYNWKKLREQEQTLKDKLAERDKEFDKKIEGVREEIAGDKVGNAIKKMTDDEETAKKVKFHYDNFKGEPKDDKEFQERIKNASMLAGIGSDGGGSAIKSGAIGSGIGLPPMPKRVEGKISDESKDMAKKHLGLTEEEIKKHNL